MITERRWLNSILEAARTTDFEMPWARGHRRQKMISRRVRPEATRVLSA